ncbi:MAG: hypothetical protein COW24_01865 [Candidatus Kerfeldbacteria bacterium CG15_BIG_FIL_POST_REV_8_21_14_020_45_12]|uniref:Glycosyltransferase 2-like domain-containing protein n=1 Tax=Candidatus Kerfeldbacteria bacterium CG15_BIG_FIL_POST_REV_8_21_14_020_45_12 TaxID=2014247 RepID=A0A2M7H4H9_9BACT|nr:MAG: hypothetical protein COW24_01865 [Candidatus Kerfeldbacteria bacterium CG15_BIG_FIL_POST_REV_8_21_14_020_45_12]PJA93164.1 MAG: hypothetical protein CO132_04245 [Candidatus Kerfeldbacteria bacterium CG_4_9_14_3_um_filter_45_8]
MKPRISIVLPAYNEQRYISNTIASLQQQDYDQLYEIIVVDTASTDGTVAAVRATGLDPISESRKGVSQ